MNNFAAATLVVLLALSCCAGPTAGGDSAAPNAQAGAGGAVGGQENPGHTDSTGPGAPAH